MPDNGPIADTSEADLEAEIHRALKLAFFALPPDTIRHQPTLRFQLGHQQFEVDGLKSASPNVHCDVLVKYRGRLLAILELKRPDQALATIDAKQALSYAKVLDPSPPLVVVTNGHAVQFYETYTGTTWSEVHRRQLSDLNTFYTMCRVRILLSVPVCR